MAGAHVVVARYDMLALDALTAAASSSARTRMRSAPTTAATPATPRTRRRRTRPRPPDESDDGRRRRETPTAEPTIDGTPVPEVSIAPWDGKKRLNILLIGADVAAWRPQHRHAHHGLDRPGDQAGRDVQPAARHDQRAAPGRRAAQLLGRHLRPEDQLALRREPEPRPTCGRARSASAATTRSRRRSASSTGSTSSYFVEVDFDGLQEGPQRARRRDGQRPGPGRRRQLPGGAAASGPSASTSRAASST